MPGVGRLARLLDAPETNIVIFGLLLNFAWEMLQMPLFALPAGVPYATITFFCGVATIGDALILLIGHAAAARAAGSRRWLRGSNPMAWSLFIATGLVITVAIEILATTTSNPQSGWRYSPLMPQLPLGVGLAPLLQWVVLPPLVIWLTRRQTVHRAADTSRER